MALIECPGCGLPRADDLAEADPCPVCGNASHIPFAEDDDEPGHDQPWVIDEPRPAAIQPPASPVSKKSRRGGIAVAVGIAGFLLGIAAGAGGVVFVQDLQNRRVGWDWFAQAEAVGAKGGEPGGVAIAPPPRDVSARRPSSIFDPARRPAPAPLSSEPVVFGPPQPAPFNPFRPLAPRAERLHNPQVYAPFIPPGGSLVARGQVKRLIVSGLEKGAFLDCLDLDAEEVVVVGKIDGGSRLSVSAPEGKVRFLARVDGGSIVDIRARGGAVVFEAPPNSQGGSRIGGGSIVDVQCRGASFRGDIAGAGTRVVVVLDPGGNLEFVRLDDRARLEYAKANRNDPKPSITRGQVSGNAVLDSLD